MYAYIYINIAYICMLMHMYIYISRCCELTNNIHIIKYICLIKCMSFVSYKTAFKSILLNAVRSSPELDILSL